TTRRDLRGPGRVARPATPPATEPRVLDEDLRHQLEKLPNVTEVYPQIRLFTDVRYAGVLHSTGVMGVPDSSRTGGAFEGLTGTYFSSPTAAEAILQADFAKELDPQPSALLHKTLVLRYGERIASSNEKELPPGLEEALTGSPGGLSIVPREKS